MAWDREAEKNLSTLGTNSLRLSHPKTYQHHYQLLVLELPMNSSKRLENLPGRMPHPHAQHLLSTAKRIPPQGMWIVNPPNAGHSIRSGIGLGMSDESWRWRTFEAVASTIAGSVPLSKAVPNDAPNRPSILSDQLQPLPGSHLRKIDAAEEET
jgi:hypothetical protein